MWEVDEEDKMMLEIRMKKTRRGSGLREREIWIRFMSADTYVYLVVYIARFNFV